MVATVFFIAFTFAAGHQLVGLARSKYVGYEIADSQLFAVLMGILGFICLCLMLYISGVITS